jgi:hypothetical protein
MRRVMGVLVAAGLVVLGLAPAAGAASGATVYASPGGTGTACSAAAACSLAQAVSTANADTGDTVVLAGGTYPGTQLDILAPMTLTAAPGADSVLSGNGPDSGSTVIRVDSTPVTVSGLTISNGQFGIVVSSAETLTVTGSTISANHIGITHGNSTLILTGSTLSSNTVGLTVAPDGPVMWLTSVTNSTITGNVDGIDVLGGAPSLTIVGTTISGNTDSGIHAAQGTPVLSLGASVFTGTSRLGNCVSESFALSVTDLGYNVVSDSSCGLGATSTVTTDAQIGLGTLAANGSDGPMTQAILPGSPASQFVPVSSGLCQSVDERGLSRPGAGKTATHCDAGGYEYQPVTLTQAAPASGTVTAGTAFTGQLAVTGATGPVSYVTTTSAPPVTVSAIGAISAPANAQAGTYQLAGIETDPYGDTGSWSYTLTITGAPDVTVMVAAPAAFTIRNGTATLHNLAAVLYDKTTKKLISGQPVTFTAGTSTVCTATTGRYGIAYCTGTAPNTAVQPNTGYTATLGATPTLAAATAHGILYPARH